MPKFEVDVSCAISMKMSIVAEDEATAVTKAEDEVDSNYSVFGRDEAKHYPFEEMKSSVSGVIS